MTWERERAPSLFRQWEPDGSADDLGEGTGTLLIPPTGAGREGLEGGASCGVWGCGPTKEGALAPD